MVHGEVSSCPTHRKGGLLKYFRYLRYVVRHKWFVLLECFKYRQYWLGVTHDISKLFPSEFIPYMNHFYGEKGQDIKSGRDETGYYKPTDTGDKAFDFAWLLHQKRNKHHWQWWCLPEDEGGMKVLEMTLKYRQEMVCDWRGAGKAQGKPDTLKWYEKNGYRMSLGDDTRRWVEVEIGGG